MLQGSALIQTIHLFVFLNCIIAADISAHVWFYYIFVVILQALNFGPQLSWQSAPKTCVLSYSPCSTVAEDITTQGVYLQQRKVLTPDPKRRVNIYCLEVSTDPTPGPDRHPAIILQRAAHLSPGMQEAQELPPPPCHPRDTILLPPVPASSNPKVSRPFLSRGQSTTGH